MRVVAVVGALTLGTIYCEDICGTGNFATTQNFEHISDRDANIALQIPSHMYSAHPTPTRERMTFSQFMVSHIPYPHNPVSRFSYSHLLVIVDIDNSLLPLPGGDLALEQDVDLAVRPALHLGQEEVGGDEAEEAGGAPDVAAFAAD